MQEFPFIGGAYEARSTNLNAQKCQNFYPVVDVQGGKNVIALMGSPGLSEWADTTYEYEVRASIVLNDYLYAVIGDRVYRFASDGSYSQMTGTISSTSGMAWMAANANDEIMIVADKKGYILSDSTVSEITSANFPDAVGLVHQDGYFIVPEEDSDRFYYSGLNDGTSWGATNYFSAEAQRDYLVGIASMGRDLWLLGKETAEVWYNSGDPFARYTNIFFDFGCGAAGSIVVTPRGLLFLNQFYSVVMVSLGGYQTQVVSTYQIDYQIKKLSTKSDARAYWYQGEGHTCYVISFPTDNVTFEYNLDTSFWNTRASGSSDSRHRGNCSAYFEDNWIVGDYENGKLYTIDYDAYDEGGETMRAVRRAQAVHENRYRLFHAELEIEFERGVGLATGQGSDPQAMLRYSDDGGHVWSNERWRSMGQVGEYDHRVKWNRLGASRERIYEVVISDPVKRNIINAYLNAETGSDDEKEDPSARTS